MGFLPFKVGNGPVPLVIFPSVKLHLKSEPRFQVFQISGKSSNQALLISLLHQKKTRRIDVPNTHWLVDE